MGGDDSQKLLPWRGAYSSPGRSKPPAPCRINTLTQYLEPEAFFPDALLDPTYSPEKSDGMPGAGGSATEWPGHFWKAGVGHFSRAPKDPHPRGPQIHYFPIVEGTVDLYAGRPDGQDPQDRASGHGNLDRLTLPALVFA
jgi:hypothetical protein